MHASCIHQRSLYYVHCIVNCYAVYLPRYKEFSYVLSCLQKKKKKKIKNFILIVQSPSPVKSLHTSSIKACLIKNVNAYTIICNFVNGGGPFCHSLILVYNGFDFPPHNKINK